MGPARSKKGQRMVHRASAHHYIVLSESGKWYEVTHADGQSVCTCPDFKYRGTECKHIRMAGQAPAPAERGEPFIIMPVAAGTCPKCDAAGAMKRGLRRNKCGSIQRYQCRNCGLRFSDNLGFEWQHADRETIINAIHLHYGGGMSSRQIQKYFARNGMHFSHVAICNWINKHTRLAAEYLESVPVQVGERWDADEVWLKVGGDARYLFALMDHQTRFILAQEVAGSKHNHDARSLLKNAREAAGKRPKEFVTDGLHAYNEAYKKEFWIPQKTRTKHIKDVHARDKFDNNNVQERLNGEFRDLEKVTRGLKKEDSATIRGFKVHHNCVKSHMGLDGDTPADRAGIIIEGPNKWLTLIQNAARLVAEGARDGGGAGDTSDS